ELRHILGERIATWSREELGTQMLARGVPASPVHDVSEAMTAAQVRHRNMVVEFGGYRGVGIPVTLDRTPGSVRSVPRAAGADTREVLSAAGYAQADIDAAIDAGVVRSADL
ncbi:MAG: CoA transferase, partial [Haloechinothrix sp.]